jgi:hypothetical protein
MEVIRLSGSQKNPVNTRAQQRAQKRFSPRLEAIKDFIKRVLKVK